MVNATYTAYINSPQWRAKREVYWRRYGRFCKACGSTSNLQVHHLTYDRFGREAMGDLMGLCRSCHQAVTALYWKAGRRNLRTVTYQYVLNKRKEKRK